MTEDRYKWMIPPNKRNMKNKHSHSVWMTVQVGSWHWSKTVCARWQTANFPWVRIKWHSDHTKAQGPTSTQLDTLGMQVFMPGELATCPVFWADCVESNVRKGSATWYHNITLASLLCHNICEMFSKDLTYQLHSLPGARWLYASSRQTVLKSPGLFPSEKLHMKQTIHYIKHATLQTQLRS